MSSGRLVTALTLLALALAGFFYFPGHTWLQSDTQIYVPMLERMVDPTLYAGDPMVERPHLRWTVYDEVAVGLRQLTGWSFETILQTEQLVFRFIGLLGIYGLARALGLDVWGALMLAAWFGLGAVVNGPSVLTLEYEPVPRGFAILCVFGALGTLARNRFGISCALAGLATVLHPTTAAPFWLALGIWLSYTKQKRYLAVWGAVFAAASAVLLLAALSQAGGSEGQSFGGRIDAQVEQIQRLRGAYNWISLWPAEWLRQYPLLLLIVGGAWWRLRGHLGGAAKWFTLALPVYGIASVLMQFVLLDVEKLQFLPQFQPARAVLYITAMTVVLSAAAAWHAARLRRWWEAGAWLVPVFALPLNGLLLETSTRPVPGRLLVLALCVAISLIAFRFERAWVVAAVAPLILMPTLGGVRNYPLLHTEELRQVSDWARVNTDRRAVFAFPDSGHGLEPGIFRAEALRGLYIDWKGGGQVNLLPQFADIWWPRWQAINEARPPLQPLARYRALGIDYIVVSVDNRPLGAQAAFANGRWAVLATAQ